MFGFFKKKARVNHTVFAEILLSQFVISEEETAKFRKTVVYDDPVYNKVDDEFLALYRLALVLIALAAMEAKDGKFKKVYDHVMFWMESYIHSEACNTPRADVLSALAAMMERLSNLIHDRYAKNASEGNMTWARAWLEEAGMDWAKDCANPVDLVSISAYWINSYIFLINVMRGSDII